NFDLFLAPTDASAKPRNLTPGNKAWDTQPAFSPDGKTLAYLAMATPGYEADRYRIVVRSWPSGQDRTLTEQWDRSPTGITWSADGKSILTVAENVGQASLYAIDPGSGAARIVVKEGTLASPVPAGNRIVYVSDDFGHPGEIFSVRPDG